MGSSNSFGVEKLGSRVLAFGGRSRGAGNSAVNWHRTSESGASFRAQSGTLVAATTRRRDSHLPRGLSDDGDAVAAVGSSRVTATDAVGRMQNLQELVVDLVPGEVKRVLRVCDAVVRLAKMQEGLDNVVS